jgi:S1-C subfamily serine protease
MRRARIFVAVVCLWVLPLQAAEEEFLRRDPQEPRRLQVQGLDKPFVAAIGDEIVLEIEPKARSYYSIAAVTITGIPGWKQRAAAEPYILKWDTKAFRPGTYRLKPVTILSTGGRLVETGVNVVLLERQPISIAMLPGSGPPGPAKVEIKADKGFDIAQLSLYLDDRVVGLTSRLPVEFPVESKLLHAGKHRLWVRAFDQAGRHYVSPPLQQEVPEFVKIVRPADGTVVPARGPESQLLLEAEPTSPDQVAAVEFWCDDRPQPVGRVTSAPFHTLWNNVWAVGVGPHKIMASMLDGTGRTAYSRPITIYVGQPPGAPVPRAANLRERVEAAVVLVDAKGGSRTLAAGETVGRRAMGTGFFVNPGGYIVTSAHTIKEKDSVRVQQPGFASMTASVAALDTAHDLAVLWVEGSGFPYLPLASEPDERAGLEIGVAGYPMPGPILDGSRGGDPTFGNGRIKALLASPAGTGRIIEFEAPVRDGDSGAPLFKSNTGEVVGVVRSGLVSDSGRDLGIYFAVPASALKQLLRSRSISFAEGPIE